MSLRHPFAGETLEQEVDKRSRRVAGTDTASGAHRSHRAAPHRAVRASDHDGWK